MSLSLLRSLLISAPLVVLATVVMGSVSVALSFFDPRGVRQDRVARVWARLLLRIGGIRVRCRGLEHIRQGQGYVFAGNHLSLIDTPVVLAHIWPQFLFLVNIRYVRLPFLGTHLRRAGHLAVDPEDSRASLRAMMEAARDLRGKGLSILLFPEGSRSQGGLREFKEGAAVIAIKAGVPVVPFAIRGTREALPVGSLHLRAGKVDLLVGEPVPTSNLTLKDRERLTLLLRERVQSLLDELNAATEPVCSR